MQWEQRTLEAIARRTSHGYDLWLARGATLLGETPTAWCLVTAGAFLAAAHTRRWTLVARPLLTLAAATATRHALAEIINRDRPPEALWRARWSGPSFPSRHTMLATLAAGLVTDSVETARGRRPPSWPVPATAAAVGASRLVLGIHWPTDILGAWIFAGCALATARSLQRRSLTVAERTAAEQTRKVWNGLVDRSFRSPRTATTE